MVDEKFEPIAGYAMPDRDQYYCMPRRTMPLFDQSDDDFQPRLLSASSGSLLDDVEPELRASRSQTSVNRRVSGSEASYDEDDINDDNDRVCVLFYCNCLFIYCMFDDVGR